MSFKDFSWKIIFLDVAVLLFETVETILQYWKQGIIGNVHVKLF